MGINALAAPSGGEGQRIGLGVGLTLHQEILFLAELFAALAAFDFVRREIWLMSKVLRPLFPPK